MWFVRWIAAVLVVLVLVVLATQNSTLQVVVRFYKWQSVELPLWVVMYLSYGAGLLTWLIISLIRVFALRAEIRRLDKQNAKLQSELGRLRNISVHEGMAAPSEISEQPLGIAEEQQL
ncbi:MAG: LapA family protein [candidate division KSB1 bacterium]|nr:LapA family protein [candidate division KSB1 bacterium]MDZ7385333.1 LapA family protein [candidate division KSB1 bacterium]MDZ7392745.1 LapA family protein [candidate division KSB1 bacterium]MDZ7414288.1 LapA family protein [candidate division KSB1 bacterium]